MRFSFLWLVLTNFVGVLLAVLLVFPEISGALGSLTYGRWMPLHMEWHLYGWCSLPLLGLLMKEFLSRSEYGLSETRFILVVWSIGLLVGGGTFLTGHASGKLFLSWHGFSRVFFPMTLCLAWSVMATAWMRGWRGGCGASGKAVEYFRGAILLVLATVPLTLYYASSRTVYPPVNPHSGGATGHSLMASSLGILGLFGVVPFFLRLEPRSRPFILLYWIPYALCWMAYLLIRHGSVSNEGIDQMAGLGLLVVLTPLLIVYYTCWRWPAGTSPWLWAFFGWWALLVVSGWVTFLPGVLDLIKFTNGMVAHAHLAMAGMITAFNFVILASIRGCHSEGNVGCFAGWRPFVVWNTGTLLMVLTLLAQGWREGANPGVLFGGSDLTRALYAGRLLIGILMSAASILWLKTAWRRAWI